MCPHSRTRSTACTKPRAHTRPINYNTIPQKDTMIPYMAQPRYPLNSQVLAILFPFATTPATPPEFTNRYSPQYGMLSFSFHFMTNTPSLHHFYLISQSHGQSNPMYATIPYPTDKISVAPLPPSLSHSPDLSCVGAQRIMFLVRFLV